MATSQSKIPIEKLISEVEKRPILYLSSDDRSGKNLAWRDLFQEFYPNWKTFSESKTIVKLRDLQMKWKSAKYSYYRNKKLLELHGQIGIKRHKYLYFDNLRFLDNVVNDNVVDLTNAYGQDDEEKEEEEEELCAQGQNKRRELPSTSSDERMLINVEVLEIEKPDPTEKKPIEKRQIEKKLTEKRPRKKSQANDEIEEFGEDKYFLMSAMHYLNKFTPEEKIDIKIEILRMIQEKLREKSKKQ